MSNRMSKCNMKVLDGFSKKSYEACALSLMPELCGKSIDENVDSRCVDEAQHVC